MTEQQVQDELREKLRQMEDQVLGTMDETQTGDKRWLAIAKTHIEQGFMAWKRSIYDGKRAGDT